MITGSSSSLGGRSISCPTAPSGGPPRPGAATAPNRPGTPSSGLRISRGRTASGWSGCWPRTRDPQRHTAPDLNDPPGLTVAPMVVTPGQALAPIVTTSLRGRPRGRLCGTIAPLISNSPPQTPQGSLRSSAPARQASLAGHPRHIAFACSTSCGDSAKNSSGSSVHGRTRLSPVVSCPPTMASRHCIGAITSCSPSSRGGGTVVNGGLPPGPCEVRLYDERPGLSGTSDRRRVPDSP